MAAWRARLRKRLFGFGLPAVVGENPLEVTMVAWAVVAGLNALSGKQSSQSLQSLPHEMRILWAVCMVVAGGTVSTALLRRADVIVASGMYMFAGTQIAFAVAIIGSSGWSRGGLTSCLYLIIGLVSFIRGWWLKGDESRYNRLAVRNPDRGY